VNPISPEAIDEGFVAQPAAGVHTVELDGKAVIYDERHKRLHVLDQHATLVWRSLDGVCSLEEVIADLSEVFVVDPAVVRTDVMSLARSLGSEGLLEGVATSG
jgi:Coenzyme PQQ synthesis protein D (PqqD)